MKKTLLASSALVGASLLAAPAMAGTVGSKDDMSVTLGGTLWFSVGFYEEDISAGNGRGYRFGVNEAEVYVSASNTADNGLKYGVNIELNGGGADGSAADEAWAFLDSDQWGRLEMGDQDDVTNRMGLGSQNAHKGLGGPTGSLGTSLTLFGTSLAAYGTESMGARADWDNNTTGDDTKVSYFTPRFSGFQLGASLTPDTGINSGTGGLIDTDNDGDFENVVSLGANYVGKFDEVGVGLSFTGQWGDAESASGSALAAEDLAIWHVGGKVDFAGFTIGAHYNDFGDTFLTPAVTALGADAGDTWSVGLGYSSGPWGISAWYTEHNKDNSSASPAGATTTELTRWGIGMGYTVAPGWSLRGDFEFFSHDNPSTAGVGATTDNDGAGFLLTNMFIF
jgi:outer membrane protein OmpU